MKVDLCFFFYRTGVIEVEKTTEGSDSSYVLKQIKCNITIQFGLGPVNGRTGMITVALPSSWFLY